MAFERNKKQNQAKKRIQIQATKAKCVKKQNNFHVKHQP